MIRYNNLASFFSIGIVVYPYTSLVLRIHSLAADLIMSDHFLVPPKPPPELKIPASKNTVKVSCIDRYDYDG